MSRIIERILPDDCYGQRRGDPSPFITPAGVLVHFISDLWKHYGDDPYDLESVLSILRDYKLSYHEVIDREGQAYRLVPNEPKLFRAWHAGESIWHGRPDCNDWMVGIALFGMHGKPFTAPQYDRLAERIAINVSRRPSIRPENVVGHEDVAPDRKNDPGPSFDWNRLNHSIAGIWAPV